MHQITWCKMHYYEFTIYMSVGGQFLEPKPQSCEVLIQKAQHNQYSRVWV